MSPPGPVEGMVTVEPFVKKVLLAVLATLLVALAVLLTAPAFIDWNDYRRDVSAVISEATGRHVAIAGDLDLSLLPTPRLSAHRISVASIEGATEPVMLRVGELRMKLAVGPLLRGRVAVSALSLTDPVLVLERTADGGGNWTAAPNGGDDAGEPGPAPEISFDAISVSNGTLVWRTLGAEPRQLDAIDATLSMAGPSGPYGLRGKAVFRDLPLQLSARLGTPGSDATRPITATVDIAGDGGRLLLSGGADVQAQDAAGTIRFTTPDAAALGASLAGGSSPDVPDWDAAMEAKFTANRDTVQLRDIALRYGKMHGTGQADLGFGEVPALAAAFEFGTMDLDTLFAEASRTRRDRGDGGESRAETGFATLPTEIIADLALSVRTARWRGGLVRNFEGTVRLESGALQIERLAAKLPGGTDVRLSGVAGSAEAGLRLDGDLAVVSDNLRAALVWLGMTNSALPPDRLRSFSFTSRIAVEPEAIRLSNIAARLDATRMSGGATIARRERPSFGLRLEMDRLGLDGYLPRPADEDGGEGATGNGSGVAVAGGFDANLNLSVGSMTWRGKGVSKLALDARLFEGNVLLRKLSVGDIGGASLLASGTFEDLPGTPFGNLQLSLEARDTERFAAFADIEPGVLARRAGGFRLQGQATGTAENAKVSGTLDIAGGRVAAQGTLESLDRTPAWDLAINVNHPDADRVLSLFLPERRRGGVGTLSADFGLAGTGEALAIRDLDAKLGDMAVAGRIEVALGGERTKAVATLSTGQLDLNRLLPVAPEPATPAAAPRPRGSARWSREPIDLSALQDLDFDLTLWSDAVLRRKIRIDDADLRARLSGGVLTMDRLTGTLFGGSLEAKGRVDAAARTPTIDIEVSGRELPARPTLAALADFDRFDGPVSLELALSLAGRSAFELVSSLSGAGTVSGTLQARLTEGERTRAGAVGILGTVLGDKVREAGAAGDAMGTLLAAFADSPAALSGDFRIESGIAHTDNLLLAGRGAQALTAGTANLPDWRIDTTTTLRRSQDGDEPYMAATLRGPIDEPAVRISGAVLRADNDQAPPPEPAPVIPVEPVSPDREAVPPKPEKLFLDILKSLKK